MKLHHIVTIALAAFTFDAVAECDLPLTAVPVYEGEDVPERVSDQLATRLTAAAASQGVVGSDNSRFFITAKFNHSFKDILAGPPQTTAIKSTLTIYMGDILDQKVYATQSFDVKGVGTSDERAYINALQSLNGRNKAFVSFIERGRTKIIEYYNANYPSILAKAKNAMALQNFDEALYYSTSIPECTDGYNEAVALTNVIYQKYIDFEGLQLLAKARAAWGTNPDEYGASEAYSYLTQINPQASCYKEAMAFGDKIAKVVKANWDFENVTKYKDSIDLQKATIKAARDVGVAYGNHQQPITYNMGWLW